MQRLWPLGYGTSKTFYTQNIYQDGAFNLGRGHSTEVGSVHASQLAAPGSNLGWFFVGDILITDAFINSI